MKVVVVFQELNGSCDGVAAVADTEPDSDKISRRAGRKCGGRAEVW